MTERVIRVVAVMLVVLAICGLALFTDLVSLGYWSEMRGYWRRYRERREYWRQYRERRARKR